MPLGAPEVVIQVPADGARYAQGQEVRASYGCSMKIATAVGECTGTTANESAIDTAALGVHTFTVTGVSKSGERTEKTVHYTIEDRRAARVSGLGLGSRTIDLGSTRAWIRIGFQLSEPAQVTARVVRVRGRRVVRVQRIAGQQGGNRFRLRASVGRRTLRPGAYRLSLVAIDVAGNRSKPITRRFSVVE